jgi:hypothetical protein
MSTTVIWLLLLATDFSVTPHGGMAAGAYNSQAACLLAAADLDTLLPPGKQARNECQRIVVVACSRQAPIPKQVPRWQAACAEMMKK